MRARCASNRCCNEFRRRRRVSLSSTLTGVFFGPATATACFGFLPGVMMPRDVGLLLTFAFAGADNRLGDAATRMRGVDDVRLCKYAVSRSTACASSDRSRPSTDDSRRLHFQICRKTQTGEATQGVVVPTCTPKYSSHQNESECLVEVPTTVTVLTGTMTNQKQPQQIRTYFPRALC